MNQYALQSVASMIPILKDGLNPVLVSVVTVVIDNLNSKNFGIYSAAVKVLDTMIIHLGNGYSPSPPLHLFLYLNPTFSLSMPSKAEL